MERNRREKNRRRRRAARHFLAAAALGALIACGMIQLPGATVGPAKQSVGHVALDPRQWLTAYTDYLPEEPTLFVNAATDYYYYGTLQKEEQDLYAAMLAVAQHPTSTKYHKRVMVQVNPDGEDFYREITRAYEALIYDHPELYWFRQNSGNFRYYYNGLRRVGGKWAVMVQLSRVYENYEAETRAFNEAAAQFMAGIDKSQTQDNIALQIHDKLIDLVSYDETLAEAGEDTQAYDYGYAAYGALVANSRGEAHRAVCDGYSYAYEYLLQQAGIRATRVGGYAGKSADELYSHSWNLVYLDGHWYETDPTWDDQDAHFEGAAGGDILREAGQDAAFWNRIRHYMYNRTTSEMAHFTPGDEYTYYGERGYATFLSSSVHERDDGSAAAGMRDYLSQYAPVADGTAYAYRG